MALYGDLISGLTSSLFLVMYIGSIYYMEDPGLKETSIVIFMGSAWILHWIAWAKNDQKLSIAAFIAQTACNTTTVVFMWPFGTDPILLPQLLWMAFIHISSNITLETSVKIGMILYASAWSIIATLLTESVDTAPTLVFCVMTAIFACALQLLPWKDELLSARMSAFILCGVFVHHLAVEISSTMQVPGHAATGGYNIIKMGILASLGMVATGAFRDQVSMKQSLQSLMKVRGKEMARQAETMQMISLALEACEVAIAITDPNHFIIWSNQALQNLVGIKANENEKISLVKAMGLTAEVTKDFCACYGTRQHSMPLCLRGKDMRVVVSPFTFARSESNHNGTHVNSSVQYFVAMNDISHICARERAEKAAEQAAMTAMQESMETLTHEMRTPLQGIIGITSLLTPANDVDENGDGGCGRFQQSSPEEMYQCMTTVMASSRMLLTLINNLLDSHKMDANMMENFQLDPVSLADAMRDTSSFCRPIAALNDTHPYLCLDFDENENIYIYSNPVRFQQVLVNLVSNAIKYAGKGDICLRAEVVSIDDANDRIRNALATGIEPSIISSPTERVAINSVQDSGDGIPSEMIDKIFQKFSQYSQPGKFYTRSNCLNAHSSGTGIGLNLCRKFVERMKGNIWVTNNPAGGACFSFCLPVVNSPEFIASSKILVETRTNSQTNELRRPADSISHHALRVLVVDDTLINLKVLERMIVRLSDKYIVKAANSGAKALQELTRNQYDLVITDIQMPVMDGIELCQAIRANDAISPKPIVAALTAETSESLHHRCAAVGISHILYKPISSHQFKSFFECTLHTLAPCSLQVP
ncbi:hypothetical protein MPSEU_000686300 [Mayamaea pseudoterrestris]|nr:hypothetical protein MPSEU_000686300 [Mayamaea pseudoterrestris]